MIDRQNLSFSLFPSWTESFLKGSAATVGNYNGWGIFQKQRFFINSQGDYRKLWISVHNKEMHEIFL